MHTNILIVFQLSATKPITDSFPGNFVFKYDFCFECGLSSWIGTLYWYQQGLARLTMALGLMSDFLQLQYLI